MKALSVKNPWAYLIIYGFNFGAPMGGFKIKDVENRAWETKYRGPLLIHASKNFDGNAWWDDVPYNIKWADYNGCIIGQVNLVDCVRDHNSSWAEPGQWHWVLKDPKPCKPIPARGALGLWEYNGVYPEEKNMTQKEADICSYLFIGKCTCTNWLFFHCNHECLRRGFRRDDEFLKELLAGDNAHRGISKERLESDKKERESKGVYV